LPMAPGTTFYRTNASSLPLDGQMRLRAIRCRCTLLTGSFIMWKRCPAGGRGRVGQRQSDSTSQPSSRLQHYGRSRTRLFSSSRALTSPRSMHSRADSRCSGARGISAPWCARELSLGHSSGSTGLPRRRREERRIRVVQGRLPSAPCHVNGVPSLVRLRVV
jgi:hypothetical protein